MTKDNDNARHGSLTYKRPRFWRRWFWAWQDHRMDRRES